MGLGNGMSEMIELEFGHSVLKNENSHRPTDVCCLKKHTLVIECVN